MFAPPPSSYCSVTTPSFPSPLGQRSTNIPSPIYPFFSPMTPPSRKSNKRSYKANPLLQRKETAADRQRSLYLQKVRRGRDDRTWAAHGGESEEMMRSIWISEQRRWEAGQARAAENVTETGPEDMQETSPSVFDEAGVLEDTMQQEQEDLQALVALMESRQSSDASQPSQGRENLPETEHSPSYCGIDDEDDDQLFLEALDQFASSSRMSRGTFDGGDETRRDEMDTT